MLTVDWGKDNLKMISFMPSGRPGNYCIEKVPAGLVGETGIQDEKEMKFLLEKCLQKLGLKKGFLRISLPRAGGRVMVMDLPFLEKKELQEAVKWEIARYLPYSPEEILYDFIALRKEKNRQKVAVAGFSREFFASCLQALPCRRSWRVDRITLPPVPLLPLSAEDKSNKVVIDWGGWGATLLFLGKGQPVLIRTLNDRGKITGDDFERMAGEIERALIHIPQEEVSMGMEKIELTGGNTLAGGFSEFLVQRFNLPVSFPGAEWPESERKRALLALALGLGKLGGRKKWKNWILPDT